MTFFGERGFVQLSDTLDLICNGTLFPPLYDLWQCRILRSFCAHSLISTGCSAALGCSVLRVVEVFAWANTKMEQDAETRHHGMDRYHNQIWVCT